MSWAKFWESLLYVQGFSGFTYCLLEFCLPCRIWIIGVCFDRFGASVRKRFSGCLGNKVHSSWVLLLIVINWFDLYILSSDSEIEILYDKKVVYFFFLKKRANFTLSPCDLAFFYITSLWFQKLYITPSWFGLKCQSDGNDHS